VINWDEFQRFCVTQVPLKMNTFTLRCRYLRHLIKMCNDIENPDDVYTYFNQRIADGTRGGQLNCYVKALNVFYRYRGLDHRFKLFKEYETPIKIPSSDDISLLLKNTPRTRTGKLVKTAIYFLVHTGLRNKEFCNLTFDNIDWSHHEIRLVGKWDRPRVLPVKEYVLNGKQVPSLKNYIEYHRFKGDEKYVFTTRNGRLTPKVLRDLVKDVARRSGIGWVHPHSFRHYYATSLLNHGVNIKVVQVLMGHGNVRETSRYLHAQEVDIRKAIDDARFDYLLRNDFVNFDIDFYSTNVIGGM